MSQNFDISSLRTVIESVASTIRKQDFLTYFKRFSLLGVHDTSIQIGVGSAFHRDNITSKFYTDIKNAVALTFPAIDTIDIVVDDTIDLLPPEKTIDCRDLFQNLSKQTKKEKIHGQIHGVEVVEGINSRLINEKYSLKNFIVWPGSQLAHAASEAVVRNPWSAYNPLFLYGRVGLGKTHLLQWIGNAIREKQRDKKVIYTTADRFLTDYVASIKWRSVDKLRDRYRGIDVLIIDDVQFLAGKKSTQEELYNIFNILYESGKQIVLSGDRPPQELTELEPRLQSRFEWGITVDIGEPDYETRLAILEEKARAKQFLLTPEITEFIAENVTWNVRTLEGILNQMIAEYDLRGITPTLESISIKLSKLSIISLPESVNTSRVIRSVQHCSYEDLIQTVSGHFGIEIQALLSEDRKKENMIPRQVAMFLLKTRLHFTYERIGNIFSGRNHTAVMYSCKKLESIMKKDQQIAYELSSIREKLGI